MIKKIAVIGAGSWGTALATVLDNNGYEVVLWTLSQVQVDEIEATGINSFYLPETKISKSIKLTTDFAFAVKDAEIVVTAVPSTATRLVVENNKTLFNKNQIIVNVSKGFDKESGSRLSVAIKEVLPENKIVVLSGPSHAEEVAQRLATAVVSTSEDEEVAKLVQDVFANEYFRVYTNTDVVGAEIGGALKNIIALAAGVADGINMGDNTKAAIMTRGMAEIAKYGVALGANYNTFYGLTGIGDLIVTCGSMHSRNRRAGILIGQGKPLDVVLKEVGMVVEGVEALKVVKSKNFKNAPETPIVTELYNVIFDGKDPKTSLAQLMTRDYKMEKDFSLYN
ncbi:MAG: NAD(P)H-dependent glycerol-3-phosphate dehydrogenase [Lachnospirales bacterium]